MIGPVKSPRGRAGHMRIDALDGPRDRRTAHVHIRYSFTKRFSSDTYYQAYLRGLGDRRRRTMIDGEVKDVDDWSFEYNDQLIQSGAILEFNYDGLPLYLHRRYITATCTWRFPFESFPHALQKAGELIDAVDH